MKLITNSSKPRPSILVCKDWYSDLQEENIWKELNFYNESDKFVPAETTIAIDKNGNPRGEHFRIHLDSVYQKNNRHFSNILKYYFKIQHPNFSHAIKNINPSYWRTFNNSNWTYSMVSYYENSHNYQAHFDSFAWTILIWFFKEPKSFSGGDLHFPDYKTTVKCEHNMLCAFPSYYLHEVSPVKLPVDKRDKGLGRYTITHFLHYRDEANQRLYGENAER